MPRVSNSISWTRDGCCDTEILKLVPGATPGAAGEDARAPGRIARRVTECHGCHTTETPADCERCQKQPESPPAPIQKMAASPARAIFFPKLARPIPANRAKTPPAAEPRSMDSTARPRPNFHESIHARPAGCRIPDSPTRSAHARDKPDKWHTGPGRKKTRPRFQPRRPRSIPPAASDARRELAMRVARDYRKGKPR